MTKIKLNDNIIDTLKIKKLHKKTGKLYCKLYCGRGKVERTHYAVEYIDGTYFIINKQEYKLLKKVISNE